MRALNPKKDNSGLIRLHGRLENADLPYAQVHLIILQATDEFTKLMMHHHHVRLHHAGPQLLLNALGREYHIFGAMRTVKTLCRNCIACKRIQAKTEQQLMGQLPTQRVTPGHPFSQVGTDFAGPVTLKSGQIQKPTLTKGYVCIFVCMITKAIHLEAVSDLTTQAFLACLRRFVGRRGKPKDLYSDNGGNFVGAASELEDMFRFMCRQSTQDSIANYCSTERIAWHFSPERAPHFGGLWEAAVKSTKFHFRRIVRSTRLTFEDCLQF